MRIEFINTYNEKEQDYFTTTATLKDLENKGNLIALATNGLTKKVKKDLIKISCCIETENISEIPKWFLECNGKIFL
jgi:hypothetical protein